MPPRPPTQRALESFTRLTRWGRSFVSAREQARKRAQAAGFVPDAPSAYCHRCGLSAGPGSVTVEGCSFCAKQRLPWDRIIRLGPYDVPLREWLLALKFHADWGWAPYLGQCLAQRIKPPQAPALNASRVAVCPVPMHWMRRWKRGYNQSHLIADALAREAGYPLVELLKRTRRTPPQTAVTHSLRQANIRGSFALRPVDAAGWTLWLVDDVKTTGATAKACASLLKQAGAAQVNLAVVAIAGQNPDPPLA